MSGRWYLPAGDTGKPTATLHAGVTPLIQYTLGPGAPDLEFRDVHDIDELIGVFEHGRALLADALAQEPSLPGLGAQGEPATGERGSEANTGQGHADDIEGAVFRHVVAGEPLPPLPQRVPAGPPGVCPRCGGIYFGWQPREGEVCGECNDGQWLPDEPQPGGTIYPELTEEALAGGVPLVSLAPEPQEDETQT